jgi:Beta-lactamase enzyme family
MPYNDDDEQPRYPGHPKESDSRLYRHSGETDATRRHRAPNFSRPQGVFYRPDPFYGTDDSPRKVNTRRSRPLPDVEDDHRSSRRAPGGDVRDYPRYGPLADAPHRSVPTHPSRPYRERPQAPLYDEEYGIAETRKRRFSLPPEQLSGTMQRKTATPYRSVAPSIKDKGKKNNLAIPTLAIIFILVATGVLYVGLNPSVRARIPLIDSIGGGNSQTGSSSYWIGGTTPVDVTRNPGDSNVIAKLAPGFPVVLTSQSESVASVSFTQITWQTYASSVSGWIKHEQLTTIKPQSSLAHADLGGLNPDLQTFAQQQQDRLGVSVIIPDLKRVYEYNPDESFTLASSYKVLILFSLLKIREDQHQSLSDSEKADARIMIEKSDNDAASRLWPLGNYDEGVTSLLKSLNISASSFIRDPRGFGYNSLSPSAMAQVMNAFYAGKFLTAEDRAFAEKLMSSIADGETFGIGDTTPSDAESYFKDGWVADPDSNVWALSSVGVVTRGGHSYIIVVDSTGTTPAGTVVTSDDWAPVTKVCTEIMASLPK